MSLYQTLPLEAHEDVPDDLVGQEDIEPELFHGCSPLGDVAEHSVLSSRKVSWVDEGCWPLEFLSHVYPQSEAHDVCIIHRQEDEAALLVLNV